MISRRRQVTAVVFGLVYGGCVVNGVYTGLSYALRLDDSAPAESAMLALTVEFFAVVAMSFLAGYVSRRIVCGVIAGALGAALILAMPALFSGAVGSFLGRPVTAALAFALAVPATLSATRLPVEDDDLSKGRVIGVVWWHWLWLWLPWQFMIANAVWLATPRFMVIGTGGWVFGDVVRSAIATVVAGVAAFKAIQALRADAPFTRAQAVARFLGWFLIIPILANLWRMFT